MSHPATPPRTLVAVQSSFIPWKGTFDLLRRADVVVLLDSLQFTKRDWRNRNRIKTAAGLRWLSIPVRTKGRFTQSIRETEIGDPRWAERHWRRILGAYGRAPRFAEVRPWLEPLFLGAREETLAAVNRRFLEAILAFLGIGTPLLEDTAFDAVPGRTERLVSLCRQAGASTYLSGPSARAYLDEEAFAREGIRVEWMSYEGYPEYPQSHGSFVHEVTILDLLVHAGARAPEFLLPGAAPTSRRPGGLSPRGA